MGWDTAGSIINDAALELALITSSVADVYASTDANVVQLRAMLKAAGLSLLRAYPWTHVQKEHTFATVNGTASYSLPADFARLREQSGWNRTEGFQLAGPVDSVGWQVLKASSTSSVFEFYFRVQQDKVYLHPTPTSAETVAYEYVSSYWVQPSGETAPTSETPTAHSDTLWFDARLLVTRIKRDFLRAKGLDSGAATQEYEEAYASATGADGAAPVLNLATAPLGLWRPLDGANVPDTGLGS